MALRLKLLYANNIASAANADVGVAGATYSVLVKNICMTNLSTTTSATVTLTVKKQGGSAVELAPVLTIPPTSQIVWNDEITLEYHATEATRDRVNVAVTGTAVKVVVSGMERDV